MFELVKIIQKFLANKFAADDDFETQIAVNDEYMFNHKLGDTEVQVGLLDNSEYTQASTFEGEQATFAPVQLTVYATQMKFGGKIYNPRDIAMLVADKLCKYMRNAVEEIDEVILCERTNYAAPYPMNEGATRYFAAVRYDVVVRCPYRG